MYVAVEAGETTALLVRAVVADAGTVVAVTSADCPLLVCVVYVVPVAVWTPALETVMSVELIAAVAPLSPAPLCVEAVIESRADCEAASVVPVAETGVTPPGIVVGVAVCPATAAPIEVVRFVAVVSPVAVTVGVGVAVLVVPFAVVGVTLRVALAVPAPEVVVVTVGFVLAPTEVVVAVALRVVVVAVAGVPLAKVPLD